MKKHILYALALVLALAAVVLSAFTCQAYKRQLDAYETRISQLEAAVAQLSAGEEVPQESQDNLSGLQARYCQLNLTDWSCEGPTLTLTTCFAQVMAEGTGLDSAAVVLTLNGQAFDTENIDMHPGEAADSFELDISGLALSLPELKNGDHLELWLEASLSDGSFQSVLGATWDWENGQLLMVAG